MVKLIIWKGLGKFIVGHKIPAGTGLKQYKNIVVGSKEEYDAVLELKLVRKFNGRF